MCSSRVGHFFSINRELLFTENYLNLSFRYVIKHIISLTSLLPHNNVILLLQSWIKCFSQFWLPIHSFRYFFFFVLDFTIKLHSGWHKFSLRNQNNYSSWKGRKKFFSFLLVFCQIWQVIWEKFSKTCYLKLFHLLDKSKICMKQKTAFKNVF